MSVNELIRQLERIQPKLREKDIVIRAENGMLFAPEIKQLLIDEKNVFGGIDNVKAMILTH